jgi:hypothetical protein
MKSVQICFVAFMSSPQPIRFCEGAMHLPPKKLCVRLIKLAETLLSQGRTEEANAVARAALRGFVCFADNRSGPLEDLNVYLSAVEFFCSDACRESAAMRNSLIRLYGRLLHMKHAYLHDWDPVEHPILRSCVLHGIAGGPATAMADLGRKSKLWRMNPDDSYSVTVKGPTTKSDQDEDDSDTVEDESLPQYKYRRTFKVNRFRGVTEKMIQQRQSPTISEWMQNLNR